MREKLESAFSLEKGVYTYTRWTCEIRLAACIALPHTRLLRYIEGALISNIEGCNVSVFFFLM
jgi:hypothetical protein